jgi:rare lipoprotein A
MKKLITLFLTIAFISISSSKSSIGEKLKYSLQKSIVQKDTVKKNKIIVAQQQEPVKDTVVAEKIKLKFYKKDAHASYYADKFHGKKTASGEVFDNNKYTAAHRKFPFGTKLKITNQTSGKSVIVEVTDRGPFSRGREIDITKRAFMEIAKNKGIGVMLVTIEEVVK